MEVEQVDGTLRSSSVLLAGKQVEAEAEIVRFAAGDASTDEVDRGLKTVVVGEEVRGLGDSGVDSSKNNAGQVAKGQYAGPKRSISLYPHHPYNPPAHSNPKKIIGGGGGRGNRRRSLPQNSSTPMSSSLPSLGTRHSTGEDWPGGGGNQQHVRNSRKMRRYHKKLSKRLRRATQAAPNNNNEFLMQEHDHLYHLDDDDSNSDEQQGGQGHVLRQHRYSSSPEEDEEDFLARDFSNTYDVVHAERLFSMSKNQLIHEYQMMEERVEYLENKLRCALLERGRGAAGIELEDEVNEDDDAVMFPVSRDDCSSTGSKSDSIPVPNSTTHGHYDSNHCNLSDSDLLISSSSSSLSANQYASQLSSSRSSIPAEEQDAEDNSVDI